MRERRKEVAFLAYLVQRGYLTPPPDSRWTVKGKRLALRLRAKQPHAICPSTERGVTLGTRRNDQAQDDLGDEDDDGTEELESEETEAINCLPAASAAKVADERRARLTPPTRTIPTPRTRTGTGKKK
jgi:hypothetical protein